MMTDTLVGVGPPTSEPAGAGGPHERQPSATELAAVEGLVRQAREQGIALTGPDGLLKALTKTVMEAALDEEMADHLGPDNHAPEGRNRGNSRNGNGPRRYSPITAGRSTSRCRGTARQLRPAAGEEAAGPVV